MEILHLTEDEDGVSHFSQTPIDMTEAQFAPPAPPMAMSGTQDCARYLFLELPPGWGGAKHPSPCRQIAFCLGGHMRVTAGDGEEREIGPGGIWLMEDVAGSGHYSELTGTEPARLAIVQLE